MPLRVFVPNLEYGGCITSLCDIIEYKNVDSLNSASSRKIVHPLFSLH